MSEGVIISFFFVPSVNSHSPALHINGSLLVPLGGSARLLPALLQANDQDSPSERLLFQLVRGPTNGQVLLSTERDGEETGQREVGSNDTFTWAELELGRVHFRHWKDKPR